MSFTNPNIWSLFIVAIACTITGILMNLKRLTKDPNFDAVLTKYGKEIKKAKTSKAIPTASKNRYENPNEPSFETNEIKFDYRPSRQQINEIKDMNGSGSSKRDLEMTKSERLKRALKNEHLDHRTKNLINGCHVIKSISSRLELERTRDIALILFENAMKLDLFKGMHITLAAIVCLFCACSIQGASCKWELLLIDYPDYTDEMAERYLKVLKCSFVITLENNRWNKFHENALALGLNFWEELKGRQLVNIYHRFSKMAGVRPSGIYAAALWITGLYLSKKGITQRRCAYQLNVTAATLGDRAAEFEEILNRLIMKEKIKSDPKSINDTSSSSESALNHMSTKKRSSG
jgi:transcription initiation factor TFIIIB Brf1 subunit/transcription initiation factor TFIIB